MGSHGHADGPERKPAPLTDPSPRRERQRILALFAPYRWRVAAVLAMIVLGAILSMVNPFLIKTTLDQAIFHHRRATGDARPAGGRVPPPAADVAGFLHPDADGGGAVADRQRHRLPGQRGHQHRDHHRPKTPPPRSPA